MVSPVREHQYPTEDAYMAACRALHWRTEQLRQAGIEPLDLTKVPEHLLTHYPPEDFVFPNQALRCGLGQMATAVVIVVAFAAGLAMGAGLF
jgi:hypothetical protein